MQLTSILSPLASLALATVLPDATSANMSDTGFAFANENNIKRVPV